MLRPNGARHCDLATTLRPGSGLGRGARAEREGAWQPHGGERCCAPRQRGEKFLPYRTQYSPFPSSNPGWKVLPKVLRADNRILANGAGPRRPGSECRVQDRGQVQRQLAGTATVDSPSVSLSDRDSPSFCVGPTAGVTTPTPPLKLNLPLSPGPRPRTRAPMTLQTGVSLFAPFCDSSLFSSAALLRQHQ